MKKLLSILVALLGVSSSAQAIRQNKDPVGSAIDAASNKPIDQTVVGIARMLLAQEIIIPSPKADSGESSVKFLTGEDKDGNSWLYVYSSKAHVSAAFPDGTSFFIMSLKELRDVVRVNPQFRGIYINSSYPVPMELFDKFFSVVE